MNKKRWIALVIIVGCLLLGVGGYCGYRLIRHEKNQNQQIAEMQKTISKLSQDLSALKEMIEDVEWLDDGYNYLAIGNSLTLHIIKSFWWNEIGMAASDADHDYYHIVLKYLEDNNESVKGVPYNFSRWETLSHDRDETLEYLNHYLSPKLDLVTVQLAENASDLSTYEEDYESLLNYIKEKAPNARILVIDDFWGQDNRAELKKAAAEKTGAEFVSLEGITDNEEYYCGLGTIVYGADGKEHVVEHAGVAKHPGDKGMAAIAERIIEVLAK